MCSADFFGKINFNFINWAYSFVLRKPFIDTLNMEDMSALGQYSDFLALLEIIITYCALGVLAERLLNSIWFDILNETQQLFAGIFFFSCLFLHLILGYFLVIGFFHGLYIT